MYFSSFSWFSSNIDLCSTVYFQEAFQKKIFSGSTATVALLVDGKVLIANVGDSKALLCTKKIQSGQLIDSLTSSLSLSLSLSLTLVILTL